MIRILGDHNWTRIVCHMLLCKPDIIPFKDTTQCTDKKAAVASLIHFHFGLWQWAKLDFIEIETNFMEKELQLIVFQCQLLQTGVNFHREIDAADLTPSSSRK